MRHKSKLVTRDENMLPTNFKEEFCKNDSNENLDAVDTSLPDHLTLQVEQAAQMSLQCLVPKCGKSQTDHPDKMFFMLPADEEKLHHWLLVCKRTDMTKDINKLHEKYGICEDHFITDNFLDGSKQELKCEAIPTLLCGNERQAVPISKQNGQEEEEGEFVEEVCNVYVKEELPDPHDFTCEENSGDTDEENVTLLCRLCASSIQDGIYIFNDTGQEQELAKKINLCLPVTVKKTDPLPKQLCMSCVAKLNLCHEFAEACIRAENKLLNLNGKNYFRSQVASSESSSCCATSVKKEFGSGASDASCAGEEMKLSENAEATSRDGEREGDEGCFCCPLCWDGCMAPLGGGAPSAAAVEGEGESAEGESAEGEGAEVEVEGERSASPRAAAAAASDDGTIRCRICGDEFDSVDACTAHAAAHCEAQFFPCCLCELCFSTRACLRDHYSQQHGDARARARPAKRVACSSCGRLFNSVKNLNSHACGSSPRPYKCQECGKSFLTEVRLAFHQQMHQGGSSMACEHCGKAFSRENNLYDHVRLVHMGEKAHCCDLCGKTFQLKSRLVAHMRVHSGERPFECGVCGGKFYDKATLKGHHLTHLQTKPFQCEKCGRCFARKTLFKQHAVAHLSDDRKLPRTYACRICGGTFVFASYAKLREHNREKHPEAETNEAEESAQLSKPFRCGECGKSFAYRVTLVAHQRHHSGELPFECEYCGKKFAQKRSLVLHRRTHTGEKPFVCLQCGKRFVQSAHLYAHARLHTGEKPYACDVCGDAFRLKDVRDAHQRKHTGERPFKCNVCEKAFRTSHSYYQHMWIHQGKKPYPCSYCGKSFRRSNGLKIHIRIHTGEKPHACDVCGRSFAQKQDMKKHRNLHVVGKL